MSVTSAVIVACERCGARSEPLDPARVEWWERHHQQAHDREDRYEHWAKQGHRVREVVEWMDMDDSRGHAACTCGWRSKSAKACWAEDFADGHLRDLDAGESA